jgi:hypothetical protein
MIRAFFVKKNKPPKDTENHEIFQVQQKYSRGIFVSSIKLITIKKMFKLPASLFLADNRVIYGE